MNLPAQPDIRRVLGGWAVWVILLGTVLRLWAWQQTHVVNPDGTLYIHQARALYYGLWGQITPCGTGFLSYYPFLIAGVFSFCGDWIQAARAVSVFFGSLTLVPLYLMLRRFLDTEESALGTLIYAAMPVFVGRSADVVRDPIYWFFLVWGMYFFTARRWAGGPASLLLSSLAFLFAAWARIEAMAAVCVSAVYLLAVEKEKRLKKTALFLSPILAAAVLSFTAAWVHGLPPSGLYRAREMAEKLFGPLAHYRLLRTYLADWTPGIRDPLVRHFLPEARNLAWLVGLGTLVNRALEAIFYPLFIFFLAGLLKVKTHMEKERVLLYFVIMMLAAAGVLYLHILHAWILDNRHMALFIFPGAVFAGIGIQRLRRFLNGRWHLKDRTVLWILFLVIVAVTLPKNLQPREKDKGVFRKIGETAARISGNREEIRVAASMDTLRWLSFYANLAYPGAPCPQPYNNFEEVVGERYEDFLTHLKEMRVHYFLWEENHWPRDRFDFFRKGYQNHFRRVGRWHHRDTGQMILFQVTL